uniref:Cytochrome P450 CYP9Z401 n=1 Tax=Cryptolaemus montrouzieri TaxID=559131 RepID=A0A0D5CP59_9CUCU|nr:cytochrome P450 CYP9Z401 [Cryptolaemus montrouzieri]
MLLFTFVIFGLLIIVYFLAIKPFNYWKERNVQTGKIIPFFGDSFGMFFGMESYADMTVSLYNKVSNVRYVGAYQFQVPSLVLRCPRLIKEICVKNSDHFLDHRSIIPENVDELWSRNLFLLKGQNWKDVRSSITPSFTSSKMKAMFVLIHEISNTFVNHFWKKNEDFIEVDFKDYFSRYSIDIIASTAFGLQIDSLKDRQNKFYMMGQEGANFSTPLKKIIFFIYQLFPRFSKFFKIKLLGDEVRLFFVNLVRSQIEIRRKINIKRPDMLGLLMEAQGVEQNENASEIENSNSEISMEHLEVNNQEKGLTESDIVSQAFIFFVAGYESGSSAMCFMAYELALNPDVQKKLIEEIDAVKSDEAPAYETIMNMTYLDMVFSETIRKWPVLVATDRVVTKPYTIEPEHPGEQPLHCKNGDILFLPIFAIHHDPDYFENPEKFDPERFSPENKGSIQPYTYLPFGAGPRNCIASRFVSMEIKAVFFNLLSHFEIVPIEKTPIPLKLIKSSMNLASETGFHLGLKRRNRNITY